MRKILSGISVLFVAVGLVACGGDKAAEESGASVSFVDLADGAEVESPVEVCMVTEGVVIEASGEIVEGHGHHHIIVNPTASEYESYANGTMVDPIPNDETHIHMGDGTSCKMLELEPGEHELLAVVADGAHYPMDPPVISSVRVTVR